MAALVIPAQVAMLPLFLLMKQLHLVNNIGGVVVPALATVFGIFLVRQYARSIPDELIEAARIDGASEMRIFFQIVLPMLKPVLVTLTIFTFMGSWNDFMWPLIVLTDQEQYTLPVALAALSREHIMDVELMMAGAVVTVIPVLLLFVALQRYYIQGLLLGSVKGETSVPATVCHDRCCDVCGHGAGAGARARRLQRHRRLAPGGVQPGQWFAAAGSHQFRRPRPVPGLQLQWRVRLCRHPPQPADHLSGELPHRLRCAAIRRPTTCRSS